MTISDEILLFQAITGVLLTVTLIGITGWYAWHTKKMSETMKKQVDLELLSFLDTSIAMKEDGTGFFLRLFNTGKIPVLFKFRDLKIVYDVDKSHDVIPHYDSDKKNFKYVYPGQTLTLEINGQIQNKNIIFMNLKYSCLSEPSWWFNLVTHSIVVDNKGSLGARQIDQYLELPAGLQKILRIGLAEKNFYHN